MDFVENNLTFMEKFTQYIDAYRLFSTIFGKEKPWFLSQGFKNFTLLI